MITVKSEVKIYAINGSDHDYGNPPQLEIHSGSNSRRVVIAGLDGKTYEVIGHDLIEAVKNAMNVNYL